MDEENQCATRGAQLPGTDRHRRRQDEGQEVAIEAEQALGSSIAAHVPHRLFDTRILVGGKTECRQIELTPNPAATTAEHDLVVGSDEDRSANLLEDGKLTELALRSLELTALGGPFCSTLDLCGAHHLGALEVALERRLLDVVGDGKKHQSHHGGVQGEE